MLLRSLFIIVLHFIIISSSIGQTPLKEVFLQCDNSIFPYLTKNMREKMLENYEQGDTLLIENALKGHSFIKRMTDSYMEISLNDATYLQIKRIDLESGQSFVVINKVVSLPQPHGIVYIYNNVWNLICELTSDSKLLQKNINKEFPYLFKAALSEETDDISFIPIVAFNTLSEEKNQIEDSFQINLSELIREKISKK